MEFTHSERPYKVEVGDGHVQGHVCVAAHVNIHVEQTSLRVLRRAYMISVKGGRRGKQDETGGCRL